MNHDSLKPIVDAYDAAKESIDVTKKILAIRQNPSLPDTIKHAVVNQSKVSDNILTQAASKIDDLFVLSIWAGFEVWLSHYLQNNHQRFTNKIQKMNSLNMLNIIEKAFYQPESDHIKKVHQIRTYRNNVAHGKYISRELTPNHAYHILKLTIQHIEVDARDKPFFELSQQFHKIYVQLKLEFNLDIGTETQIACEELRENQPNKNKLLDSLNKIKETISNSRQFTQSQLADLQSVIEQLNNKIESDL